MSAVSALSRVKVSVLHRVTEMAVITIASSSGMVNRLPLTPLVQRHRIGEGHGDARAVGVDGGGNDGQRGGDGEGGNHGDHYAFRNGGVAGIIFW